MFRMRHTCMFIDYIEIMLYPRLPFFEFRFAVDFCFGEFPISSVISTDVSNRLSSSF